jgi:UDP-GlcNAc:undecaprenyl-phosphate GlcNAc-1-phosphate transferase
MRAVTTAGMAAAVVLVSAPMARVLLARARVVDIPNTRSSHLEETTRGGGVAVALGCTVAALVSRQIAGVPRAGLLVAAVGMGLIGLVDDLRPLEPGPRLVAQIAISAVAVSLLDRSLQGPLPWQAIFSVGAFVWIVGYVNAFNFMDGINGISVAQAVVAGVTWWILGATQHAPALAVAGAVVAAASTAFAPFNLPRARMFLGDVGSYFLGGWMAATAVIGLRSGIAPEAVLSPLALYCVDTSITLIGRVRRGEPWNRPHRQHVYQRLVHGGWSHTRTTLSVASAMTACSALGALSLTGSVARRAVGDLLIAAVLVAYVTNPWAHPRPGPGDVTADVS